MKGMHNFHVRMSIHLLFYVISNTWTFLFCRLYQLTWLQKIGYIYDRSKLSKVCHHLFSSNPSSILITNVLPSSFSDMPKIISDIACCRLQNLLIKWMMDGGSQLMEKFCLEVMVLQHYIKWILKLWKVPIFYFNLLTSWSDIHEFFVYIVIMQISHIALWCIMYDPFSAWCSINFPTSF